MSNTSVSQEFNSSDGTTCRIIASKQAGRYSVELWLLEASVFPQCSYIEALRKHRAIINAEILRVEGKQRLNAEPQKQVFDLTAYKDGWIANYWVLDNALEVNHLPLTKEVTAVFYEGGEWNSHTLPSTRITKLLRMLKQVE